MERDSKIYVAGHRGLAGSAILRRLKAAGYHNFVLRSHSELELTDQAAVRRFFAETQPAYVFLAAAKVGGIHANNTYRAEFIYQNIMVQSNVIDAAYRVGVRKLLFLGTSCIYPKFAPQPMQEESLLSGKLESTNEPYAIAKIAGIKMCDAYNRQYGSNFLSVMPTNLYGPGDSYDLENSHFVPALIRKMHEAKSRGDTEVVVWGTGTPRRELLYSDDLASACVFLMERHSAKDIGEFVNIGVGKDHTIREIAGLVKDVVGFKGSLTQDTSKPDGTPQKLLDVSRITALGWTPSTSLQEGIAHSYKDFLARYVPDQASRAS